MIRGIIEGFSEFIFEKNLIEDETEAVLNYVPYSYDLIDAELDFDETYYADHLLHNLDKMIDNEVMNVFRASDKLQKFSVNKGKMVFRKQVVREFVVEYSRCGDTVQVTTKIFRNLF